MLSLLTAARNFTVALSLTCSPPLLVAAILTPANCSTASAQWIEDEANSLREDHDRLKAWADTIGASGESYYWWWRDAEQLHDSLWPQMQHHFIDYVNGGWDWTPDFCWTEWTEAVHSEEAVQYIQIGQLLEEYKRAFDQDLAQNLRLAYDDLEAALDGILSYDLEDVPGLLATAEMHLVAVEFLCGGDYITHPDGSRIYTVPYLDSLQQSIMDLYVQFLQSL